MEAIILATAATLENGEYVAKMKERRRAMKVAPPPILSSPTAEPFTRREIVLLAIIVLVGAGLRLVAMSRSAVEHFDEGVYASNLYFAAPEFAYPQQRFYAPPLLPALIEAGMLAGLPPNVAALLPAFLAGCGTIVALWWFGRSWFGPAVGLAAATLAALSEFHIAYSATALTDVLLGLWLILAVDAIARSLAREDFRWAIGAGLYTGLAWWTKYNGWLPLAIEAAALPLLWLITQQSMVRKLGCFAVTAAIALAVWSPYFLWLQSSGGYGPISANHAKYVVGLTGWLDSAGRQISAQYVMQGLLGPVSLGVSLVLVRRLLSASPTSWLWSLWRDGSALLAGLIFGLMLTSFVVAGVAAGIGIAISLIALLRESKQNAQVQMRAVATCLIAAWWLGLLLATPFYWPYPRLVLPWVLASWIGTAVCWHQAERHVDIGSNANQAPWRQGCLIAGMLFSGLCLIGSQVPKDIEAAPASDRRGLQRIAAEIRRLHPGQQRALYIAGEPGLFFQLAAAGEPLIAPVQDIPASPATIDGRPIPTLLVLGPHAHRDPQLQQQWAAAKERWPLNQAHDYQPSEIVWLDLHDPRQPDPLDKNQLNRIEVYRLK